MPASPPTTPYLGLPRFASDMAVGVYNGLNQVVDALDNIFRPWTPWTPVWTQSDGTVLSIGQGTMEGRYRKIGKTVFWRIYWERGTGTNVGSDSQYWNWTLPPVTPYKWNAHGGSLAMMRGGFWYGGNVFPTSQTAVGAIVGGNRIHTNSPAGTHTDGDWIVLTGTYEAA